MLTPPSLPAPGSARPPHVGPVAAGACAALLLAAALEAAPAPAQERAPGAEAAPAAVDWSSLGRRNFPYRFVQRPGPMNALGRVKFMFPNRFNVYLHDTPARGLFARGTRTFSSGCIRVEKANELAERLLVRPGSDWTAGSLQSALVTRRERTVPLPEPVPIHIQYWTAWAEPDGTVQFREDVYGRDRKLIDALDRAASTHGAGR